MHRMLCLLRVSCSLVYSMYFRLFHQFSLWVELTYHSASNEAHLNSFIHSQTQIQTAFPAFLSSFFVLPPLANSLLFLFRAYKGKKFFACGCLLWAAPKGRRIRPSICPNLSNHTPNLLVARHGLSSTCIFSSDLAFRPRITPVISVYQFLCAMISMSARMYKHRR